MTSVLEAPVSPMSAYAYPSVHDAASKMDITHLSGATMADLIMEPKIHLVNASPATSKCASMISSKRVSVASQSTTKSALRQSNQLLIEMLQNIQVELAAHRTIMLDIQHRVSHLEHESNASVNDAPSAALRVLEGHKDASRRNSRLVPPEGRAWWEACQNFARNAEPPLSATEFLRTPKRFSGIDWQYGVPSAKPNTPPATPPDVDDLPPLTPTSEEDDHYYVPTPYPHDIELDDEEVVASTPKMDESVYEDDIKEHTVEVNKKKLPTPPILQPPPGGKPIPVNKEEVITAIAPGPVSNTQRYYKGVKSLATYKAVMKHKPSEKGKYRLNAWKASN